MGDYTAYSINELANMTGGNYRTVRNILYDMVKDGQVKSEVMQRNGRDIECFFCNGNTIRLIQQRLKIIKGDKKPVVSTKKYNLYTIDDKPNNGNVFAQDNDNDLNVTIYEVTKKNNELENKIVKLELSIKDLEMRNTVLDSDNKIKDNTILLITDKQKEYETRYHEKNQEVKNLQKALKTREYILIGLVFVLVIVFTILSTIYFIK